MEQLLVERVAFSAFGFDIYWYGLIISSAIMLAFGLLYVLRKREGLDKDAPVDLLLCVVPIAIVGARLFSVTFEEGLDITDFFKFREGGMSIIGACIGGLLGIVIYCLIKKKNVLSICDLICPLLILGQAIGRWGNYFNSEVYGREILDESMQWFPFAVEVSGRWFMALFFYESVLNLLGFVLLISLFYLKKRPKGIILASYLTYYGTIRFILEGLRQEEYVLRLGSLPISRFFSGIMVVGGITIFAVILIKAIKQNKGNKDLKYGKERV